jgi:hypothetical protein
MRHLVEIDEIEWLGTVSGANCSVRLWWHAVKTAPGKSGTIFERSACETFSKLSPDPAVALEGKV